MDLFLYARKPSKLMKLNNILTCPSFSSFFTFLCSGSCGVLGRYFSLSAGEMEFL